MKMWFPCAHIIRYKLNELVAMRKANNKRSLHRALLEIGFRVIVLSLSISDDGRSNDAW